MVLPQPRQAHAIQQDLALLPERAGELIEHGAVEHEGGIDQRLERPEKARRVCFSGQSTLNTLQGIGNAFK